MLEGITIEHLVETFKSLGHVVFTKPNSINLFGVRSDQQKANDFDDRIGAFWKDETGQGNIISFAGTTDPGTFWLKKPMKVDGTAIMIADQYRAAYKIGNFKGYKCLRQVNPMKYVRDNNRDGVLDFFTKNPEAKIEEAVIGSHIHRANAERMSTKVNKWSAACQVVADPLCYAMLMDLCFKSAAQFGNSFTYTLIYQHDIEKVCGIEL